MAIMERHMFSGANTPTGFFSYFDHIIPAQTAYHIYCIKGGPGVGKSTFMKKIAGDMTARGKIVEYIHCSSDPGSLDGIVLPQSGIALIDGTAPHIIDPKYPGAVDEIINLGQFWDDRAIMKHRDSIISCFSEISAQFSRAYSYLAAAGNIRADIVKTRMRGVDERKLDDISNDIIGAEFSNTTAASMRPGLRKMFATAITPDGLVGHIDTLISGCGKVYVLQGESGCGSEIILDDIARQALKCGLYAEAFYCPMDPDGKIEHLLVPELGLAVCTSNTYHAVAPVGTDMIELGTADCVKIQNEKNIFNLLLDNALNELGKAKGLHDELEENYVPNMNFNAVEEYRQATVEKILAAISD